MRALGFIFLALLLCSGQAYANKDSIGVKTVGGKLYILHKVLKGEGLYGIGRRYNVSVANIQDADPSVKDGIDPGDIVMVPAWKRGTFKTGNNNPNTTSDNTKPQPQQEQEPKKEPQPEVKKPEPEMEVKKPELQGKNPKYYIVKPGETLFGIAKKQNVAAADVQKWNGLKSNSLSTGQKLIIGYTDDPIITENQTEKTTEVGPEGSENKSGVKADHIDKKITEQSQAEQKKLEAERKKGKVEMKEMRESGVATWIDDGSVVSEKKLALHRTAPVGTIILLTNPRTGKKVYVKVIGKLPDAVDEKNVVIKVTKNTAEELGAIDQYFRVEMNYAVEVFTGKK